MNNKPYHHGDLRNNLIEAGIDLINREGITGFSLRKVAAKCNVSHAAPYSHFKDIDDLICAMGEHVTKQFMEKLKASMIGQKYNPQSISILGEAYISFFIENPQYFQFLFYNSGITIDLDNDNTDDYPPFVLFREAAYQMFQSIQLPEDEYLKTLITLWSMVHGISSLLTNKNIRYSGDWNDIFKNNILFRRGHNEDYST